MPLSFIEMRYIVLLIIILHFIVISYAVNYARMKKSRGSYTTISVYPLLFVFLFFADFFIGFGMLGLQLSEDVSNFIERSQTGVGYAFIFGLGALIFLISGAFRESESLHWYSVLATHVTVFFIGMTFVVDLLIVPEAPDYPFQDLAEIGVAIAIGVIIDLIRKKKE